MRRSSYTRPPGASMMTPLRVANRENINSNSNNARRSSSTSRTSGGASCNVPAMKRPRIQGNNAPPPAQAPRRSSIFANNRQEAVTAKDPRMLGDRNQRDRAIHKIVQFLSVEGYLNKITTRTLATPNTKDVVQIYNFMFRCLDENYVSKGKPEEDIPRMLSIFCYPYQLSRNHLYTVAAQHSWPHVLGGLVYLVDAVQAARNMDATMVFFPKDDEFMESEKETVAMHFATCYQDYLNGSDDFTPHDELLKAKLSERWHQGGNSVVGLQEKNRRLRDQLEEIKHDPNCLENKQERVAVLLADVESHSRYLHEMNCFHDQFEKQLISQLALKASLSAEIDRLDSLRKEKQQIIDQQGISPADVLRINAQKQELVAEIRVLEEQSRQVDDQIWKSEIKLSKRREAGDTRCSEVNLLIRKCFRSEDQDQLQLSRDANVQQLARCFDKIELEVRSRAHKAESERDAIKDRLDMLREEEDGLEKNLQVKQIANKTQADEYERFMRGEREEMDALQKMLDDLQHEIDDMMSSVDGVDEVRVTEIKKEYDGRVAEMKRRVEEYGNFLLQAVSAAANHKEKLGDIFNRQQNILSDPQFSGLKTK